MTPTHARCVGYLNELTNAEHHELTDDGPTGYAIIKVRNAEGREMTAYPADDDQLGPEVVEVFAVTDYARAAQALRYRLRDAIGDQWFRTVTLYRHGDYVL